MRHALFSLSAALLTIAPHLAHAQQWGPLDTVPHPNVVIAHDTSVTMNINTACNNCHDPGSSRLEVSKQDILQTLPLFRPYFNYGAFQYAGCDSAQVTTRVLPTPDAPDVSYAQVLGAIGGASACHKKEERLPGGAVTTCATAGCGGDTQLAVDLANLSLPGFDPLRPFLHVDCIYHYVADLAPCVTDTGEPTDATGYRGGCYHIGCSDIGGIEGIIFTLQQLPTIDWPRWTESGLTPEQVQAEFCAPVKDVLTNVYNQILACRPDNAFYSTFPTEIESSDWCDANVIAQNACTNSPLANSCVCDNTNQACIAGGQPTSACGTPFTWKARQQVAVCEAYQPGGAFDSFYQGQADNVVNGECRENAVLFFTDGYMGDTPGTTVEGSRAIPTYRSVSGLSNMAVFRVADSFTGMADGMMRSVTNNVVPTAYSAVDQATMQESFSRLLNRIFKGVYTGAAMTLDSQGTRAVFHSFTVPGYNQTGPISDNYLGWPARLSMHEVGDDGTISATPVWETDWADRVGGSPGCGPTIMGYSDTARLGPNGTFRNGVPRAVGIPASSMDRDGDGVVDNHPALRFGEMYSIASTRPVIVEAPREAPNGRYGGELMAFQTSAPIRERIRSVYVMGNGYVYGFHGGAYDPTARNFGTRKLAFSYDDSIPQAGMEIMRYGPRWLATQPAPGYRYDVNDLIQQPLTTGQLTAREMRIYDGTGYHFHTVLVGAQGKNGGGYFSLDITDPCAPAELKEWTLPNPSDRASAEPLLYYFPSTTADERAVVITTGGLGGTPTLYAHDIVTGNMMSHADLPGGGSYIAAPICLDATGQGHLTHCYALREDGLMARVDVGTGGFGAVSDITPPGVAGGGRRFTTTPAVFFDPTGNVNLVFGSGDFERLTQTGVTNYIYKIVDRTVRKKTVPNQPADVATACNNVSTGRISLGPQERVISPPMVGKGIVAWTTYSPSTNACISGGAKVYAMNYLTCTDAVDGAGPPTGVPVQDGLPASPVLHRDSQNLLVGTSAGPTASQVTEVQVLTRGGANAWTKRLYWRSMIDAP